jgi:hypothetical protein
MSNNSIKVVARFRPQNRIELESGGKPIVAFDGNDSCTVDVSSPLAMLITCAVVANRSCREVPRSPGQLHL